MTAGGGRRRGAGVISDRVTLFDVESGSVVCVGSAGQGRMSRVHLGEGRVNMNRTSFSGLCHGLYFFFFISEK